MSNQPNNKQVSVMALACVTVIAITMMVLTAMMNVAQAQTAEDYSNYTRSVRGVSLMTNYEQGLVFMKNEELIIERDVRVQKAIRQGVIGLFLPVFYIPAAINATRILKVDIERERRARFFNSINQ